MQPIVSRHFKLEKNWFPKTLSFPSLSLYRNLQTPIGFLIFQVKGKLKYLWVQPIPSM